MEHIKRTVKLLTDRLRQPSDPDSESKAVTLTPSAREVSTDQVKPRARKHGPIRDGFQSLPSEVRCHLLSLLDLQQLRSLVHASPVYHQQYLNDRRYVLSSSIKVTLSGVTADAYAVHILSQHSGVVKALALLYDIYTQPSRLSLRRFTEEECISMAGLYFSIRRIADRFSSWVLDDIAGLTSQPQQELTAMETLRITRACYRFNILSRLAAPGDHHRSLNEKEDDIMSFFNMIEPWEVEEILSFCQFAENIYDSIFNDIKDDLHPNNPRFNNQPRPPTPDGAFELDRPRRRQILESTMLNGITLLDTVLFRIKDHEHLVITMQKNIQPWSSVGLNRPSGMLGESEIRMRRQNNLSERDRLELDRAPLPFRGDVEADPDDDSGQLYPPLAWTVIWGGTYSNLYGWFTSKKLRRWGYVFWDAARIQNTTTETVLREQWDAEWGEIGEEYDSRDHLASQMNLPEGN